ncbi:MAG: choice-of-anchor B family protein [Flavobacteriales bacterium]|nr:choice-of-anchor B family protein [Flavobacteriales bacterium]
MRIWVLIAIFISSLNYAQEGSWNVKMLDNWTDSMQQVWYQDNAYNEVWGFVQDGEEYAVIGSADGTTFLQITDDNKLHRIQFSPGRENTAIHRDYHDYQGYLYEVCDEGKSTLRIYDLSYLPDSIHLVYDDSTLIERCHNIFIDSSSGILYACGVTYGTFDSPMRLLSLADPEDPQLLYDYTFVDYVHDVYVRNDSAYINAAFEGLRVADFSTPTMPIALGSLEFYPDKGYNHSGWLSEDGRTYVMCDETETMRFKVCDVSDLSDIRVTGLAKPPSYVRTLPHNVMLKEGIAYFSYYCDGLQIYDVREEGDINRIGYFDTFPDDTISYHGAWGVYSFLPSERILVSDRKHGLFLLGYDAPPQITNGTFEYTLYPNIVTNGYTYFYKDHTGVVNYNLEVFDAKGALIKILHGDTDYLKIETGSFEAGIYLFRYVNLSSDEIGVGKFMVQNP